MTTEEFKASLVLQEPPVLMSTVQKALWHDAHDDWSKAHEYAQQKNDSESAWVHAYLHRKEGDESNAQYWYSRANKEMPQTSLQQEWEQLVDALAGK